MGFLHVGVAKESANVKVGYADFIRLCNVRDVNDWLPGLRVAFDGVWVQDQSDHLAHLEHAILSEHPDGDPSRPVLTFPCTVGEIESRIVDFYGNNGFIDPFEFAEFVAASLTSNGSKSRTIEGSNLPTKKSAATREMNNLLRIIAALLKRSRIPIEKQKGGPDEVARAVEEHGFDEPKVATIRKVFDQVREVAGS